MRTLYLSDLDGTLLRADQSISEYTAATINRFVRSGGCFSYATARSIVTASKVTTKLDTNFPVICYNGVFTIENQTREIIASHFFTAEDAASISTTLHTRGIYPIVYAYVDGEECFSYIERFITLAARAFISSRAGDPRHRAVQTVEELYAGDIFYFTCLDTVAEMSVIYDIFREDSRCCTLYSKDVYSDAQFCELIPAKASKATAALQLKSILGCDRIVAFGDGSNDISLFSIADECYAMANAVPELKTIATAVIDSNDNDGVAKWLEENVMTTGR